MENHVINDVIIRDYLLGHLDSQIDVVQRLDEQILTDPDFSISVDVVEDEIIEEYLEGTLSPADTRAVERHFLRPPERQRKLRTARLFSRYLQAASPNEKRVKQPGPARRFLEALSHPWTLPNFRTCAEIGASILFVVSVLNLVNQRNERDIAIKEISGRLAEERKRSAASNQELQHALQLSQPSTVMLSLVKFGLQRGEQDLPKVKVDSGTRTLHVEVAVSSRPSAKYRVQLQHTGETIWSGDVVDAAGVQGGTILKLNIPAEALPHGVCELAVIPLGKGKISYWFVVSKPNNSLGSDTGSLP